MGGVTESPGEHAELSDSKSDSAPPNKTSEGRRIGADRDEQRGVEKGGSAGACAEQAAADPRCKQAAACELPADPRCDASGLPRPRRVTKRVKERRVREQLGRYLGSLELGVFNSNSAKLPTSNGPN